MAITLITGLPGHGKTLYTLFRWRQESEKESRPVFYSGIKINPDGPLRHWQEWKVEDWEKLPPKSIFIVDEAQFAMKVQGRGMQPEWMEKLTVHRHSGIDFVLSTQNPMLLDSYVRRLVDRHFHIVRKFGTRFATIHEFVNGVQEQVAKSRSGSIRHEWRYPPDVFQWYTSAEVHTVRRRIPMRVWLFLAIPFIFGALALLAWSRLRPHEPEVPKHPEWPVVQVGAQASARPVNAADRRELTPLEYAKEYQPRIAGLAHTAPAYDKVTEPRQAPYPAACVSMPSKGICKCYTQQATALDTPKELCEQVAAGGFFVAWDAPAAHAVSVAAPGPAALPGEQAVQARPDGPPLPPSQLPPQRVAYDVPPGALDDGPPAGLRVRR